MKTKEQNTQNVVNYLTKTAGHTFEYPNGEIFKVLKVEDSFYVVDEKAYTKVRKINIDTNVGYYEDNTKNVMKQSLFLNKNLKSVKTNRYTKDKVDSIFNSVKISAS